MNERQPPGPKAHSPTRAHRERHASGRSAWLRAAVLGANDAIVSVASLIIGVASSNATHHAVISAGAAGLVAGAMSMAAGEFVSVSSQRDAEDADIEKERAEVLRAHDGELEELAEIYVGRGLDARLAREVARQLSEKDALEAHLRDELGIAAEARARPLQAAWISATSFAIAAAVPLGALLLAPVGLRVVLVAVVSLACLISLGAIAARLGGAPMRRAAIRVVVGGAIAMGVTAAIGRLVGVAV